MQKNPYVYCSSVSSKLEKVLNCCCQLLREGIDGEDTNAVGMQRQGGCAATK